MTCITPNEIRRHRNGASGKNFHQGGGQAEEHTAPPLMKPSAASSKKSLWLVSDFERSEESGARVTVAGAVSDSHRLPN